MVRVSVQEGQGAEGALSCSLRAPDKLLSLRFFIDVLPLKTFHLLTLIAENGGVDAGTQIVFPNANGRLFDIDHPEVEERADHLAQMAAATFLLIDLDLHLWIPSRFTVARLGTPFLFHP